jgi:hypothetical protein
MDKVQKPSNNECYTPSSEPFRMYTITIIRNIMIIPESGSLGSTLTAYSLNGRCLNQGKDFSYFNDSSRFPV